MLREFFLASRRIDLCIAWLGLAAVIGHAIFTAYIKYTINNWYNSFYDHLQKSGEALVLNGTATATQSESLAASRDKVMTMLMTFGRVVAPAVLLNPTARWIKSHWAFRWRLCLMKSYMEHWDPNEPPIEGASQRLHEDTQRFSKGVETYLTVLLNSLCTLLAFTPILFSLGRRIIAPSWPLLRIAGDAWMLFCAVMAAALGLGFAMIIGRKLVGLEVANQRVEAEVRREAVVLEATPEVICGRQRDSSDDVSSPTSSSSAAERLRLMPPAPHFKRLWSELHDNYSALFKNFLGLNLWLDCFDQFMVVAPYLLVAPRLFAEKDRITLGTLVQTSNSFGKVFDSLSIISENWGGINEWRSTFVRLKQFERQQAMPSSNGLRSPDSLSEPGEGVPMLPIVKG